MKNNSQLFNRIIIVILVVFVLFAWHTRAISATPTRAQTENDCNTGRSIQVSGTAIVNVTPDRALIQLGVQSNGNTPDSTHQANLRDIRNVIDAVRALGIEAKDIATDYYIVYPVYDNYDSLFIKGYRIDNTVSITVRDIQLADDVILAALKVGANEVQDVQFYTSELRKFRDQARDLAMKAASEKAHDLAEAAGAQAGCVMNINENTWSQYYGSWRGGRQAVLWAQNVSQNASSGTLDPSADSPVSLGQISVRAEVNASYSLK
jgi:hypothetical protein